MSWRELAASKKRGIGDRLREGVFWLVVAFAAYFFVTFLTYSPMDPGWSFVGERDSVHNLGGPAGAWFASVFYSLFGIFALLFPVMLVWSGWLILRERTEDNELNTPLLFLRWTGFALTIIGGSGNDTFTGTSGSDVISGGAGGMELES